MSSLAVPRTIPAKPEAGVKETIESIVIAFILAFIFRCFVVEAFVIPTGSMAPTLMGAHLSFRCPDCGYRFAAGYPDTTDSFSVPVSAEKTYGVMCPNCGLRLPRSLPNDSANDASDPAVRYGDRILVMKYLYLLHPARRWDVVVFKTPDPPTQPGDYTINYIKRLCGLPGERLFVADGDLYVSPDTGQRPKESDFVVQTKTRPAQDALWRIVFDADYVPVGLPRQYQAANGASFSDPAWRQPWTPAGGGWANDDRAKGVSKRQFAFDNPDGTGTLKFDPTAVPNTAPLTDWLAYDQTATQVTAHGKDQLDMPSYGSQASIVRPVGDLKLSATIDRLEGDGVVRLVVGKQHESGPVEFAAEVSQAGVKLVKTIGVSSRPIGQVPLPAGRPTVAVQNVDYRVALLINGKEVLSTTPADYAPDIADVIRRAKEGRAGPAGFARIDGERCTASLSHVQLWRDAYYRDTDRGIVRGTAVDFPDKVVKLAKDEYFTMGDNSFQSSDGRYWSQDVDLTDEGLKVEAGIVPDRFLLGRAFFVYWPAGFRPLPQSVPINPPLLPNFGDMRFIR